MSEDDWDEFVNSEEQEHEWYIDDTDELLWNYVVPKLSQKW